MLARVGNRAYAAWAQTWALLGFVGENAIALAGWLAHPARIRWRPIAFNLRSSGWDALPIVGTLSFLMGVVVAYQGADQLRRYGANIFVADLVGLSMLREFAPDIIHTMHISANHHGRIAALGLGIPVVTHLHNVKREKRLHRRLSDKLLSYATAAYITVSHAVAEVLAADHNVARRPVRVFHNAIDPKRCDLPPMDLRAAYGISGPVILSVGRYVRQKNLDLLIRAVRILHDQGLPASLVLVGEGVERSRLEALRDDLNLGGHVVLTGFRSDVAAFFRAADVFAMPSDFEGFPIAQMEALYCGMPCVVSRHVPSLEVAADASLVCETDPSDIAAKLLVILRDDALRARLSEAARRIAEPLTMPRYAERLHSFYTELLAGNLR